MPIFGKNKNNDKNNEQEKNVPVTPAVPEAPAAPEAPQVNPDITMTSASKYSTPEGFDFNRYFLAAINLKCRLFYYPAINRNAAAKNKILCIS